MGSPAGSLGVQRSKLQPVSRTYHRKYGIVILYAFYLMGRSLLTGLAAGQNGNDTGSSLVLPCGIVGERLATPAL